MAAVRCQRHGPIVGRTRQYHTTPVQPVGYPETALICGTAGCEEPGLVWLENGERDEYDGSGARIFPITNGSVKLRVK